MKKRTKLKKWMKIKMKMDDYDPPSYEETEEKTSALPYKTQRNSFISNKPISTFVQGKQL